MVPIVKLVTMLLLPLPPPRNNSNLDRITSVLKKKKKNYMKKLDFIYYMRNTIVLWYLEKVPT